jgi:LuxR family maltose regulon positive regulatory protein
MNRTGSGVCGHGVADGRAGFGRRRPGGVAGPRRRPPVDVALPALLNDLSARNAKRTLILDDYHMLTDVRIHEAVEYLLSYLPPSLRLVIAARFDPPLPLARMRARGELSEIRAADLRFSPAEAAGLVSAVGKVEVGSDAAASAGSG